MVRTRFMQLKWLHTKEDITVEMMTEGLKICSKTTSDVPQIVGKTFPIKVLLDRKPPFQHPVTV